MKNRGAKLFYTSKLSTVRSNIVANFTFDTVLGNRPGRLDLKQRLLVATGRDRGTKGHRYPDEMHA